jgi:eukaryotic-like serine/threonine-protein kinase
MEGTTVVGRYKLLRRLAAGGMGEVYLAAQTGPAGFEKVVALKRMLPTMAQEREVVRLFLDEARLVARLSHRNICQIVELGEDGDGYFVAMEYIQGPSVRGLIDRLIEKGEELPAALAIDIAAQVTDALAYAYSAPGRDGQPLRIIHRDVTPQNILISVSGDVKLIDFGVAKSADQSHVTQTGTVKGKLAYMSPEQSRGAALDQRSDLFSVGVVLSEMLTGVNPYARPDLVQTIMAIQGDPPPPLSARDPRLAPIDAVVARLLAKKPDDRFRDANEAYEELTAARQAFPRPPKRLGPFVSDYFSADLNAVIKAVSDSGVRSALRKGVVAAGASISQSTPATQPGRQASSSRQISEAEVGKTYVKGDSGETFIKKGRRSVPAEEPGVSAEEAAEFDEAAEPAPKKGTSPVLIAVTAAVIVIGLGGAGLAFLKFQSGPSDVLSPLPPSAERTPTPIPNPPTPPTTTSVAQTPPSTPPQPPSTPNVIAEPTSKTAPPERPAPPTPEPKARPEVRPPPHSSKTRPEKPSSTTHRREPPVVATTQPVVAASTPTSPPRPAQVQGTMSVIVGGSRHQVDLAAQSGHVMLVRSGGLTIGADYAISGGVVSAKITCEPFAIVAVDGVTKGVTKAGAVDLGALSKRGFEVELHHPPNADGVNMRISADVSH